MGGWCRRSDLGGVTPLCRTSMTWWSQHAPNFQPARIAFFFQGATWTQIQVKQMFDSPNPLRRPSKHLSTTAAVAFCCSPSADFWMSACLPLHFGRRKLSKSLGAVAVSPPGPPCPCTAPWVQPRPSAAQDQICGLPAVPRCTKNGYAYGAVCHAYLLSWLVT